MDMTKSSGYRMNYEAIYAISRCCVEARALRSRAIFEDINVDVQNTRSPSLLERSGTFYVTDMTKSSGYRMNCEAIYAISRCCVEVIGCGICFLWVFIEKIISAKHVLCEAERFSKI